MILDMLIEKYFNLAFEENWRCSLFGYRLCQTFRKVFSE